jgi:hypothetical protein
MSTPPSNSISKAAGLYENSIRLSSMSKRSSRSEDWFDSSYFSMTFERIL